MNKRILALLVLVTAVFFAAASPGEAASVAEGKILSVKDVEHWQGTDMFHCEGWNDFQAVIADTVLTQDPKTGKLLPGIASAYSYSNDGLTLRLTFPEGMKFPNGDQLEPEDFIASIEYGRDGVYADGYENIKSMEVDGRDVVCHLSEYRSDLDYFLGNAFVGIISKKQLDKMSKDELLWGAVPYGPFYVEENVQGSHVVLKPNPGYKTNNPLVANKGKPYLAGMRVNLTEMEDFSIATALKEGDFDFVVNPSIEAIREIKGAPGITMDEATFPTIEFVALNNDNKHLNNPKVREAIFLLADRNSFADMVGSDFIPQYTLVIDTMMNYSKEAEDYFKSKYSYNPERARKLLAEAGYKDSNGDGYLDKDGVTLELSFIVGTTGMSVIVGQDWQIQLKEHGIKLNLETLDWEYRNEKIRADDYDMARASLGWGEPILLLNNFRRDPNAVPNKEAYDAKVKALAGVLDYDKRTQLVGEMLKGIYDDLNCLPLYTGRVYCAYGKKAEGVKVFPNAAMYFNDIK